jgi:hypothetical protein
MGMAHDCRWQTREMENATIGGYMKTKIFISFTIGLVLGSALGSGVAIWLQRHELPQGAEVQRIHRDEDGATYRIQAP